MRAAFAVSFLLFLAACGPAEPPAPTCTDGERNGSETDVDCGGSACGKCALGKLCGAAGDCVAGAECTGGHCVAAPRCDDGAKNGAETDVDCGGGTCGACADGQGCAADRDCGEGLSCQSNALCGPKLMNCGDSLDCTQACTGTLRSACVQDCLERTTPDGQQKLVNLSNCIDKACSTKNGGVCDQAAPGYVQQSCADCLDQAFDTGGACEAPLLACYGG